MRGLSNTSSDTKGKGARVVWRNFTLEPTKISALRRPYGSHGAVTKSFHHTIAALRNCNLDRNLGVKILSETGCQVERACLVVVFSNSSAPISGLLILGVSRYTSTVLQEGKEKSNFISFRLKMSGLYR